MIGRSSREGWLVVGLVALGVALPLAINAAAGVLDVPYSDDFTFRRTASALHETGLIRLGGWSIMTFIGQLAVVQPFLALSGGAPWAFTVVAALFTAAGIGAGYALARRSLPAGAATLAAAMVLLVPGFLVTAPTFMTDIPAWAAEMGSLALGALAIGRPGPARGRVLGAALAAGVFAFSIREFGLAAPVAVLLAASAHDRPRWRRSLTAWLLTLSACAAIYWLTSGLPGQAPAQLHRPTDEDLTLVRQSISTIALAVSPALVLATAAWLRRSEWRDRGAIGGAVAGLAVAGLLFGGELLTAARGGIPAMLVGNAFAAAGSTGSGAGAGIRPVLFLAPTWKIVNLLALVSVTAGLAYLGAALGGRRAPLRAASPGSPAALLGTGAAWLGTVPGMLIAFAAMYTAGALTFGVVGSLYDRYLWPVVLPIGIVLLGHAGARGAGDPEPDGSSEPGAIGRVADRVVRWLARLAIAGIVIAMAAASLALVLNRAAFDQSRWTTGEQLVAAGSPADRVDAGYEWVGFHAERLVVPDREVRPGERWYHLMVAGYQPCAVVAASAIVESGLELVSVNRDAYRLLLVAGPEAPLYIYRSLAAGCP